jgi:tetratricopeptide (TPR) repeat protein
MCAACGIFLCLTLTAGAAAPGGQKGKASASLAPQAKSKLEVDTFNLIACKIPLDEKTPVCPDGVKKAPVDVVAAAEAFMKNFPASALAGEVFALRMDALLTLKQFDAALDDHERAMKFNARYLEERRKESTDKNSKELQQLEASNQERELNYYQRIMEAASAANEMGLAAAAGDEILSRIPNHYPTLLLVARTSSQNLPTKDPKRKAAQLEHAEEAAQLAINYMLTYLEGPQGEKLPPEKRAEQLSQAHSIMGWVYLQQEHYADAQRAYRMALSLKKNDPLAYYYLGYSYYLDSPLEKPESLAGAIDAELKSVALKGPTEPGARELLKRLYVMAKHPQEDIEKDIERDVKAAAAALGK